MGLVHVNSSVRKVIINGAFSDSIVFEGIFYNTFLEIGIKPKDLSIILKPGWLDSRNIVVDWFLASAVCEIDRSFHSQ